MIIPIIPFFNRFFIYRWVCVVLLSLGMVNLAQATTFLVTNTADSGTGSLRQAIIDANANAGIDTVSFNILGGTLPHVISLLSPLPEITDFVFIDGTSEPDFITEGVPVVRLDGINAGLTANGLVISAGASTIKALIIENFQQNGIVLSSGSGNVISNCYIGADGHGLPFRPNAGYGILLDDSSLNLIESNLIASNGLAGIAMIGTSSNNELQENSIYANGSVNIDLNDDGVTVNDVGDSDTGANGLQNYPVLDYAYNNKVVGQLNSTDATSFRLEFFANPAPNVHSSGYGGGTRFLGSMTVTTSGNVANFTFPYTPVMGHSYISATATNLSTVETSEYSLTIEESKPIYTSLPLPATPLTFSSPVGVGSSPVRLQIVADGNVPLSLTVQSPVGANAGDFSTSFVGNKVLLGGESLEIDVVCTPTATGARTAGLTILSDDANFLSVTYPLDCDGVVASVAGFASNPVAGSTINLSSVVGSSVIATVDISETGNSDLNVTADPLSSTKPADFTLISSSSFVIPDGGSPQSMVVSCTPSAVGTESATLTLRTNDPAHPTAVYTIQCTGTAAAQAGFASNPLPNASINVSGVVGSATLASITISEVGSVDLNVVIASLTSSQPADFTLISASSFVIPDGGSPQTVIVRCTPSIIGTESATLVLQTNDPLLPTVDYTINCIGTSAPQAGFSSIPIPNSTLTFISEVGTPSTNTITVLETGNAALTVTVAPLTGSSDFSLLTGTGSFTIADGGSPAPILVRCLPSMAGTSTATLSLSSNDPSQPTLAYFLVCIGTNPIPVDPTPIDENLPPTDIFLSNTVLFKQDAIGTVVGTFSSTDPNAGDTHTYLLANDSNGRFSLLGNQLITNQIFEIIDSSYTISVTSIDNKGLSLTKQFLLTVSGAEITGLIQTDLGVSGDTVTIDAPEHITVTGLIKPASQHIGVSADIMVTYDWISSDQRYTLSIPLTLQSHIVLGKEIPITLFKGHLNFLTGEFHVTLGYRFGNTLIKNEIVHLTVNTNNAPTALALSNIQIGEYSTRGTTIGTVSATDADKQEQFRYALLDNDDGRFMLVGNQLQVANGSLLQANDNHDYHVNIRAIDIAGATIDSQFNLQVVENNNLPLTLQLTRDSVMENSLNGTIIGRLIINQQKTDDYQYQLIDDAQGRFQIIQDLLIVSNTQLIDYEQATEHHLTVSAETGNGVAITQDFTIQVINQQDLKVQGQWVNGTDPQTGTIQLTLTPDNQDIGQEVGLIIVGVYMQSGYLVDFFNLTPEGWQVWDKALTSLQSLQSITLSPTLTLPVWQGSLSAFSDGSLAIYAGYYVIEPTTGKSVLVYDLQPFIIEF
ncbi:parallel beta-helix repeat (two copies) [Beggiatoa alba B18LD]|uniref:Parallel beta-helix repeat (Two copies) n=1 Tax=Beggiatoa alba B18LD TaxID=395493 RepID=I3CE90_9GAMM|nr:choice-of-anchor D domain-containing protein [Beggiatoa alba]EIJ41933.1 parallel beta-helix repeat (two copies) [Beggiatoa alba B18LD]